MTRLRPILLLAGAVGIGAAVGVLMRPAAEAKLPPQAIIATANALHGGPMDMSVSAAPTVANEPPLLPSLEDLLPGLEAKVAADPGNLDLRLLLAQTYLEVGRQEEGIQVLRGLRKEGAQPQVPFLLGTELASRESPAELDEALACFEESVARQPEVAPLARLYQGRIHARRGKPERALTIWKQALDALPSDDQHRGLLETAIAGLNDGGKP